MSEKKKLTAEEKETAKAEKEAIKAAKAAEKEAKAAEKEAAKAAKAAEKARKAEEKALKPKRSRKEGTSTGSVSSFEDLREPTPTITPRMRAAPTLFDVSYMDRDALVAENAYLRAQLAAMQAAAF